jgi:hypothetical protein
MHRLWKFLARRSAPHLPARTWSRVEIECFVGAAAAAQLTAIAAARRPISPETSLRSPRR